MLFADCSHCTRRCPSCITQSVSSLLPIRFAYSVALFQSDPYALYNILPQPWVLLLPFLPDPFLVGSCEPLLSLSHGSALMLRRAAADTLVFLFLRKLTSRSLQSTKLKSRHIGWAIAICTTLLVILCIYSSIVNQLFVYLVL